MKGKLTLLFLVIHVWAYAQEDSARDTYTLERCIEYALANSVDARNAKIDEQIATARVKETVGIGLPQVTGAMSVQQSPTQPRFFGEYDPDQDLFGLGQRNPNIEAGDVGAAENFFQLKGAGDASLSINQLIFNGSYIVGLQAANAYKDLSVKSAYQTNEQVVMNVSRAFYNLLITRERLELITSNLKRIDTLFRNTQAMYQNGFAEKLDVDRLKVSRNNLKVNKADMETLAEISLKLLKFQMNYPYEKDLVIQGTIQDEMLQQVELPKEEEWEYSNRPDYQVLKANYTLQELNIRNKYAEAVPVISAFANLGYSTQSPNFGGIFTTNADFEDLNGVGPDRWYGYSTVGLRLSWNLFTGLQRTFQIQQEKLSLQKIENNFEKLKKSIDLEIEQSSQDLDNALERLGVQQENMDLAAEIFDVTQIKYKEGVGSYLEVIEADNSLKEAQTNYYSALYDALIAQLELKKALGILHNN